MSGFAPGCLHLPSLRFASSPEPKVKILGVFICLHLPIHLPIFICLICLRQTHCDRFAEAAQTLARFLDDERYAEREELADARVLLGRSYQLQKKFDEALDVWRHYLAKHPAHSSWTDVQRAIVDTEFVLGAEARQAKRYEQARQLWQAFMAKYPLDRRNPRIMLEFGSMHFQEEQWNEAIADWRRLVSKYPGMTAK